MNAALAVGTTLVTAAVPSIRAGPTPCPRRFRHRCSRPRHTSIPPASGLIAVGLIDRNRLCSETLPEYPFARPGTPVTTSGADTCSGDSMITCAVSVGKYRPYGNAIPKEQGVTAALTAHCCSRQGHPGMRLNCNGSVAGPLSADAARNRNYRARPCTNRHNGSTPNAPVTLTREPLQRAISTVASDTEDVGGGLATGVDETRGFPAGQTHKCQSRHCAVPSIISARRQPFPVSTATF